MLEQCQNDWSCELSLWEGEHSPETEKGGEKERKRERKDERAREREMEVDRGI